MFAANLSLSLSRFSALPCGPRTRSRGARVVAYTDWELHSVKGAPCLSISKALSCDTSPHECKMHKVVLYNGEPPVGDYKASEVSALATLGIQTDESFTALFEIDEKEQLWCTDLSGVSRVEGEPLMRGVKTHLLPGMRIDLSGRGKELQFSVERTCYAHA